MAPVGQASMQRVQLPHTFAGGWAGSDQRESGKIPAFLGRQCLETRPTVVIISDKNIQDPNSLVIRQEFFPIRPSPACSARARSRMGPVSMYDFVMGVEAGVTGVEQEWGATEVPGVSRIIARSLSNS